MNDSANLPYSFNPIELLGYAKNSIVDVLDGSEALPINELGLLKAAYKLLDIVQDYFYLL